MSIEIRPFTGGNPADLVEHDKFFYFLTSGMVYLNRPTVWGTAVVAQRPPDLQAWPEYQGSFIVNDTKLPGQLFAEVVDWFRRIYEKNHSEAEVLLTYNPKADPPFRVFVPPQRCTIGSVNSAFNVEHLARGWQLVGSIHSHCDFSAFHSGTDTADASEFDGLHITVGHVNTTPEYAVMFAFNGKRWSYTIDGAVDDLSLVGKVSAPEWWDRYVLGGPETDPTIRATYDEYKPATPRPWHSHAKAKTNGPQPTRPYSWTGWTQPPDQRPGPTKPFGSMGAIDRDMDPEDEEWNRLWSKWDAEDRWDYQSWGITPQTSDTPPPKQLSLPLSDTDRIRGAVQGIHFHMQTLASYQIYLNDFLEEDDLFGPGIGSDETPNLSTPDHMLANIRTLIRPEEQDATQ